MISSLKQHLIDPELCIRCNACWEVCPAQAIEFDGINYIVDPARCDDCKACQPGCPTGAIEATRFVPQDRPYSLAVQSSWSSLPPQVMFDAALAESLEAGMKTGGASPPLMVHGLQNPITATVLSNRRLTAAAAESDIHEIVLSFGDHVFGGIEGQSIGVLPEGAAGHRQAHHMRAYSLANPRDGETPGDGCVSLVVKRVVDEWGGRPYRGVASNFLCDTRFGDVVRCVGPIGSTFLLPPSKPSRLLMICTGTGIAPMWGFIRRNLREGMVEGDGMMLIYGGRVPEEMAYHAELQSLQAGVVDMHFAYSRLSGSPKRYVQDVLREEAGRIGGLIEDPAAHIYVCGLRGMETGVSAALEEICVRGGYDWETARTKLQGEGRLHFETY